MNPYVPNQPLSYFSNGKRDADMKIFILHGRGQTAEGQRKSADFFAAYFPNAEVIAINGPSPITRSDGATGFSWYSEEKQGEENGNKLIELLRANRGVPEQSVIFGFSEGGFVAADIVSHVPDLARHAILHSSGLLEGYKPKRGAAQAFNKCSFNTVISLDDPCIRNPIIATLCLALHYKNALSLKLRGHNVTTRISNGFAHAVSPKSLAICAEIVQQRLAL